MAVDLHLEELSSDLLVELATHCELKHAEDELITRAQEAKDRLISKLRKKARLSAEDIEDAKAEANFWIKEAIAAHDTSGFGEPGACSFESFRHRVLQCRFIDYLRALGRDEKYLDRFAKSVDVLDDADARDSARAPARAVTRRSDTTDPALLAERHEFRDCLNRALSELDEMGRRIWELRSAGTHLRAIAADLGMTPDAVKHRWYAVRDFLRVRLAEFA